MEGRMKTAFDFVLFALSHAKKSTLPEDAQLPVPHSYVGSGGEWEYLYGTTGVVITPALLKERYNNHYGPVKGMTQARYAEITKDFPGRIACDCQGVLDCFLGVDVNAQMNYANWCTSKGTVEKTKSYDIGECFFMYNGKKMNHVGFVCGYLPSGEELVVEERGITHGCVITKRSERAWTHHGKPTAKLDYSTPITIWTDEPEAPITFDMATPANRGNGYLAMQQALNAAGFTDHEGKALVEDGAWGKRSYEAFMSMVDRYARPVSISLFSGEKEIFKTEVRNESDT
jgi:hypothetical protein